eukprot:TRINITY_DN1614_c0_g1_i2.p1 TRINITY_DN1614_c0_g1~~TRINITY_DN1614_c0_g1_i2.p1  ORF type:complete len:171 (-),score=19.34 TRINITY_DN1614_c0_g1_i2:374-886(-)
MEIPPTLKYVGYAVAGGVGLYYVQTFYYISVAQGQQGKVEKEINTYKGVIKEKESRSKEIETKVNTLSRTRDIEQEDLSKLQEEIAQTRTKLAALEAKQLDKQSRVLEYDDKIQVNRKRILDLRGEIRDVEGSLTMSERSLIEARQAVNQATNNLNPLRHPSVRQMFGSS